MVGTYHQVADPAHWLGIGLEGWAGVYSPGLYLTAELGRLVALTGPSGAGQSTLLWVIAGAARPTAGEVNVGEVRIDHRDRAIGEQVGLIPQGNGLATVLTARENISIPLLASGAGSTTRAGERRVPWRQSDWTSQVTTLSRSCRVDSSSGWRWPMV